MNQRVAKRNRRMMRTMFRQQWLMARERKPFWIPGVLWQYLFTRIYLERPKQLRQKKNV